MVSRCPKASSHVTRAVSRSLALRRFRWGTLDTNRSLLKYILLGIITFGIYDVWVLAGPARTSMSSHRGGTADVR